MTMTVKGSFLFLGTKSDHSAFKYRNFSRKQSEVSFEKAIFLLYPFHSSLFLYVLKIFPPNLSRCLFFIFHFILLLLLFSLLSLTPFLPSEPHLSLMRVMSGLDIFKICFPWNNWKMGYPLSESASSGWLEWENTSSLGKESSFIDLLGRLSFFEQTIPKVSSLLLKCTLAFCATCRRLTRNFS